MTHFSLSYWLQVERINAERLQELHYNLSSEGSCQIWNNLNFVGM